MIEERAEAAMAALKDDELRQMFRNIWRGMRHEEARRKAVQAQYIDRSANNG